MAGTLSPRQRRNWLTSLGRGPLAGWRELESLLERFWDEEGDGWSSQLLAPPIDLSETDKAVCLRMDLPGANPKEIDIQASGSQLTVSGERKEEKESQGETFHRVERRAGRFSRTISLPCTVEEDQIDAQYKDGILTVTMPKTAEATTRRIEVKT